MVGDDLGELGLDVFGIGGLSSDSSEGNGSGVNSALLDEPSGGLGEEEESNSEDQAGYQYLYDL